MPELVNLTLIERLFHQKVLFGGLTFMPCKQAYCSSMCLWILWCFCKLFLAFVKLFYYELLTIKSFCKYHFLLYLSMRPETGQILLAFSPQIFCSCILPLNAVLLWCIMPEIANDSPSISSNNCVIPMSYSGVSIFTDYVLYRFSQDWTDWLRSNDQMNNKMIQQITLDCPEVRTCFG